MLRGVKGFRTRRRSMAAALGCRLLLAAALLLAAFANCSCRPPGSLNAPSNGEAVIIKYARLVTPRGVISYVMLPPANCRVYLGMQQVMTDEGANPEDDISTTLIEPLQWQQSDQKPLVNYNAGNMNGPEQEGYIMCTSAWPQCAQHVFLSRDPNAAGCTTATQSRLWSKQPGVDGGAAHGAGPVYAYKNFGLCLKLCRLAAVYARNFAYCSTTSQVIPLPSLPQGFPGNILSINVTHTHGLEANGNVMFACASEISVMFSSAAPTDAKLDIVPIGMTGLARPRPGSSRRSSRRGPPRYVPASGIATVTTVWPIFVR